MVLNALGFSSRAMYLMPDYLRNKPIELLIAPGLSAKDFNDDALGRSLDDLYAAGCQRQLESGSSALYVKAGI
jgi:hypothetical protein